MTLLYIAAGGALGALTRWGMGQAVTRFAGHGFPYATLSVNVLGSCLMGLLIGWLLRQEANTDMLQHFAAIGFLGSFTTFSTFSLDFVMLAQRGETVAAVLYAALSFALSIGGLLVGLVIVRGAA